MVAELLRRLSDCFGSSAIGNAFERHCGVHEVAFLERLNIKIFLGTTRPYVRRSMIVVTDAAEPFSERHVLE